MTTVHLIEKLEVQLNTWEKKELQNQSLSLSLFFSKFISVSFFSWDELCKMSCKALWYELSILLTFVSIYLSLSLFFEEQSSLKKICKSAYEIEGTQIGALTLHNNSLSCNIREIQSIFQISRYIIRWCNRTSLYISIVGEAWRNRRNKGNIWEKSLLTRERRLEHGQTCMRRTTNIHYWKESSWSRPSRENSARV